MADPEIKVPQLPDEYMAECLDQFKRLVESVCNDIYGLGYAHGDAGAIARILKAAQPTAANEHAASAPRSARPRVTPVPRVQGAATHRLIQTVLRDAGTTGATPTEIAKSPANRHGAGRSGIGKILRRGAKRGKFVVVEGGRYTVAKAGGKSSS